MAIHEGYVGGHLVEYVHTQHKWVYADDQQPATVGDRPCGACGMEYVPCKVKDCPADTPHDPCLGHIDGMKKVCCGHEGLTEAYQYPVDAEANE